MNMRWSRHFGGAVILSLAGAAAALAAEPVPLDDTGLIARGRYLVAISGCNDCHTAGYPQSGGRTPEQEWLTGDVVGFQGPWGVSYPANLRLSMNRLSEEQWLALARAERLPPMPWFNLAAMTDEDLRAIYAFVKWLGPKGQPAPLAVKPGEQATTPVIVFVPQVPEGGNAAASPKATSVSAASPQ
ncbi:MAG TPA: hypothetical protein VLT59_01140 [Steroidobacteraceae bacterium]|nr:hypothetical protein [Steroidobacteraceae bacterium]